jgi:hypothetical protein
MWSPDTLSFPIGKNKITDLHANPYCLGTQFARQGLMCKDVAPDIVR